jgi:hypothetical protein
VALLSYVLLISCSKSDDETRVPEVNGWKLGANSYTMVFALNIF